MSQPTIWIDLTDLMAWSGHHTGIQRVVYQLALGYADRPDVKFFFYNDARRVFIETRFQRLQEEDPGQADIAAAPSLKSRLKRRAILTAKSAVHRSPEFIRRQIATAQMKDRLRHHYHETRNFVTGLRRTTIDRGPASPTANFEAGDTVLIMGKAWDYPGLMPDLAQLKTRAGFKIVQVLYDLLPSLQPQLFGPGLFEQYTRHMFEAVAASDGFVSISESSRRDLGSFCEQLRLPQPPSSVMRLGDTIKANQQPTSPLPKLKTREFLLCVGTLEVRKNHALLYSIYKLAALKGIELPNLVMVGGRGWYTGDVLYQIEHDPETKNKIQVINGITDSQLTWLYQNCRFTLYPSVYEGWGLPIAESLGYGKLCISSSTSSMTEIAGDLLDYFLPYDAAGALDLITKYLNPAELERKETEIARAYHPTEWKTTYEQFDTFVTTLR